MKALELTGKKVSILGWGVSGRAAAGLARSQGAEVFVSDSRSREKLGAAAETASSYEYEFGGHTSRALDADVVVISPGIPPGIDLLKNYRGELWSEIELAYRFNRGRIVGITGTNGKSTTTTLIGRLLEKGVPGAAVRVVGNIGRPFSEVALESRENDVTVIELSSFQLETIRTFRPDVAVLLNIKSDHLDRYRDFEEYRTAKCRIFMNMSEEDTVVLNIADKTNREISETLAGPRLVTVSPNGRACYTMDDSYTPAMIEACKAPENLLCAVAVADLFDVPEAVQTEVFENFEGLPHRLEKCYSPSGIRCFNDSKATNIAATISALRTLGGPVVLILGGRDKGEDYSELRSFTVERPVTIVAYGEAAKKIAEILPAETFGQFDDAVNFAMHSAAPSATVLLSPACSSYDQFSNFEERGDRFRELVSRIGATAEA